MKSISGKKFARVLEKNGWILIRINGSHHIYMKNEGMNNIRLTIPIHSNKDIKLGLLKHLLKLAELTENDIV